MKIALSLLSLAACTAAAAAEPRGLCEDTAANRQKITRDARFELDKRLEVGRAPDWSKLGSERIEFERHMVRYVAEFDSPSHTRASATFDCKGLLLATSPDAAQHDEPGLAAPR